MKPQILVRHVQGSPTEDNPAISTVYISLSPGNMIAYPSEHLTYKEAVNESLDRFIKLVKEAKIK